MAKKKAKVIEEVAEEKKETKQEQSEKIAVVKQPLEYEMHPKFDKFRKEIGA